MRMWPEKNCQMSIKVTQKWFDTFTIIAQECRRFGQINCCPKSNKSPDLVTLRLKSCIKICLPLEEAVDSLLAFIFYSISPKRWESWSSLLFFSCYFFSDLAGSIGTSNWTSEPAKLQVGQQKIFIFIFHFFNAFIFAKLQRIVWHVRTYLPT